MTSPGATDASEGPSRLRRAVPRRPADAAMPVVSALLPLLALLVLAVYVAGTAAWMLRALARRLRLRRPLVAWRTGRGIPLAPTLFLGGVALGLAGAGAAGWAVSASAALGIPAGGVFWLVAAWVDRSVVVTEYGIVVGPARHRRAVAWGQFVDVAATAHAGQPRLVLVYRDRKTGARRRLALSPPAGRADDVRAIVRRKLGGRLAAPVVAEPPALEARAGGPLGETDPAAEGRRPRGPYGSAFRPKR